VATKDINGAGIITLVASSFTLKLLNMAKIKEYPRRATAEK